MIRSIALLVTAFAILASTAPVGAQGTAKVPRIGFFSTASAEAQKHRLAAFRQGLQEIGYAVGKDIVIVERYARRREQRAKLAAELVALGVDVIVAQGAAARAAKKATTTIPVVMIQSNPVGSGLVKSLAQPGGNVTGLASQRASMVAKRLQILKDAVPSASRVSVLSYTGSSSHRDQIKILQAAAPSLGVTLIPGVVRTRKDFDRVFSAIRTEKPDSFIVLGASLFRTHRERIIKFAADSRQPAIYSQTLYVKWGGLMSYGANISDLFRRLARYVDKILRGAKPAHLPVEQSIKFDLAVNLKTAKALGVTFPQLILLQATEVIE